MTRAGSPVATGQSPHHTRFAARKRPAFGMTSKKQVLLEAESRHVNGTCVFLQLLVD